MQSVTLSTNQTMPTLGLGTFALRGTACIQAIKTALRLGYTHFDTAEMYGNHRQIGQALQETQADRSQLFITSKVLREHLTYDGVLVACDRALTELQLDYLDLYLIHWPNNAIPLSQTLQAFSRLVNEGKVKSIGVSNFTRKRLTQALDMAEVPITVNQVEYHPYLNQEALRDFCQQNNVTLTAYSPLAKGRVLSDSLLQQIANTHSKSPAQVALRWLIQKGIVVIPKASSDAHMQANLDSFAWTLSAAEMTQINTLPKKLRLIDWAVADFDD